MRSLVAPLAVAALLGAGHAGASDLVSFGDNAPNHGVFGQVSDSGLWAEGWTQSFASSNVTVSVPVDSNGHGPGYWWITSRLGAGATSSDLIVSGSFSAPDPGIILNTDNAPRTVLATGLNFAPGAYYLVLLGPQYDPNIKHNDMLWAGEDTVSVSTHLAPGFTVISALSKPGGTLPDPFPPASDFTTFTAPLTSLFFDMTGDVANGGDAGIPEPDSWTLMIVGFGLSGAALRSRRASVAA